MLRRLGRPSPATVMAFIALTVSVSTGGAWAATQLASNSVGAKQIKRNAVGDSEIKRNAVRSGEIRNGSVNDSDLADGVLRDGATGPRGPQGLRGPQGFPGTARAYAYITPGSCPTSGECPAGTISDARGVTAVRTEATGQYCITVPGANPLTTPAAAGVEFNNTSHPEAGAQAALIKDAECGGVRPNEFKVITQRLTVSGNPAVLSDTSTGSAAFWFIVP